MIGHIGCGFQEYVAAATASGEIAMKKSAVMPTLKPKDFFINKNTIKQTARLITNIKATAPQGSPLKINVGIDKR